jgi:hypothetical protein
VFRCRCSGCINRWDVLIKEDPVFDLKTLPDDLKYSYIDDKKTYPVIISSKLSRKEEERLLEILRKHRGAIGYTLDDLKGISSTKKSHFCFLDGYSGFSQIAVKKQDQEKTTFTCPYGTYACRSMPFGLCNAPATFQICLSAMFHGFCEEIVEVFMDKNPSRHTRQPTGGATTSPCEINGQSHLGPIKLPPEWATCPLASDCGAPILPTDS